MGIATTHLLLPCHSKQQILVSNSDKSLLINSMSEDYHNHHHQGFFSNFSNGFERSQQQQQHLQQHQHHMSQQIRRDKLRIQGFHEQQQPPPPHPPPPPLDAIEEVVESTGLNPVYETAGMLSEMFNFTSTAAGDISNLENNYRNSRPPPPATAESQWYGNNRQLGLMMGGNLGPLDETKNQDIGNHDRDSTTTIATSTTHHHHRHQHHHPQQISGNINADSASAAAAAMHLFLMNPQPRSPSPPPPAASSSTLHMLLPNQGFHPHPPQFHLDASEIGGGGGGGIVEGQGLSLSLSSSLQHLEKAEELRMGGDGHGMIFFNQGGGGGGTSTPGAQYPNYKNMGAPLHLQSPNNQVHVGYGSSIGMVNVLRNSKYAKAAQELLEEFCSVGRGHLKKNKLLPKNNNNNPNPNSSNQCGGGNGGGGNGGNSSSSSKDLPPLSASDRLEHQRRKVKLLTMLDEVDRRYNHYCEQMQMVVNSFDLVMGFGAAIPYTALAQKAMSRHFRCLKDAIAAQLKQSCEMLGEKDAGTSGVTKGETPRLRLLEQSLRQQRAFHQMGMMEQEAWRPQRGLPERSVNILRAWLFEHFLHPYPSDADKHLLARQTGLSRNQVSNWFINARVRLWKPMVEDMYQQEAKEEEEAAEADDQEEETTITQTTDSTTNIITQIPTPTNTATANTAAITSSSTRSKRSEINDSENDPSLIAINTHCSFPENQAKSSTSSLILPNTTTTTLPPQAYQYSAEAFRRGGGVGVISGNPAEIGASHHLVRFGTNAGDVSLTLGLRHAGNLPQEKSTFSVRDFGGC